MKNLFWNSKILAWLAGILFPVKPSPLIEFDPKDDPAYGAVMGKDAK